MDLTIKPNYYEAPPFISSPETLVNLNKNNPFEDNILDPICDLNLKETSEFVKALPMGNNKLHNLDVSSQRRRSYSEANNSLKKSNFLEAPCTPGRPIFSFSLSNATTKKSFPSKWDDAEKWLNGSSSCNESPAHFISQNGLKIKPQIEVFAEKPWVNEEKLSKGISVKQSSESTRAYDGVSASLEVVLKDKLTNQVETFSPKSRWSDATKERFFFSNLDEKPAKRDAIAIVDVAKHRDIGTEMTPLGSSTTSRCPTPFKSTSPIRHNTPASRSGPLALTDSEYNSSTIDIAQLNEGFIKTGSQFGSVGSGWSSREEEEEDVSKSLRHFEYSNEFRKSISENRTKWEEEEKNKCCLRYQREEARIQAWVNLQTAKAEAQSKRLEVKIQKMRSDLEEKLMKRMAVVQRKAEEWRADAQFHQSGQIQKATKQAHKMLDRNNSHFSSKKIVCGGCFPCNSNI